MCVPHRLDPGQEQEQERGSLSVANVGTFPDSVSTDPNSHPNISSQIISLLTRPESEVLSDDGRLSARGGLMLKLAELGIFAIYFFQISGCCYAYVRRGLAVPQSEQSADRLDKLP